MKRLLMIGGAVFALIIGLVIYNYLSLASVTVSAGSEDNVSIARLENGRVNSDSQRQAKHSLHTHLKPGMYKISAYNHLNTSSQVIELKAWQHDTFSLSLETPKDIEAVLGQGVRNLFADSSSLSFVDESTGQLTQVGSDNQLSVSGLSQTFSAIKWLSASKAVAEGDDGNLYLIDGGNLNNLGLPSSVTQNSNYQFDVNSDGTVYLGVGGSLYKGSVAGSFQKIYSAKDSIAALAATKDRVALIYSNSNQEGVQAIASRLVVVSSTGKKIAEKSETNIFKPQWSKDGRHLVVKGDYGGLLFSSSLDQETNIPVDGIGDIAWLNDRVLVYAEKATVWKYDLSTTDAQQISNTAGGTITAVYPDTVGSYVYLQYEKGNITGTSSSNVLGRIGLKNQSVKPAAVSVGLFLPDTAGGCTLSYLNFVRLSVIIYLPAGADQSQCEAQANDLLSYYGIKVGSYGLQVLPQPAVD